MSATAVPRRGAAGPIGASLLLHVAAAAAFLVVRPSAQPPAPPIYRVDIVAAPPGPRAIGAVTPAATPPPPVPTTPPPRAATAPVAPTAPPKVAPPVRRPPPAASTPVPPTARPATPATAAPAAGGGPTGGRGADVATVRTQGIDFPYPGYLNNIVRQLTLRFSPKNPNAPLRAEVRFVIRRDGSVSDFAFVTRSGNYGFDLDAQGAVEAAASARAFGPLPDGFPDDALPIYFSFNPSQLR
ncbi:MAG TPA: TonB C-terminal domain-containing protein [Gemmatimonadaceae bacterium]|nr:TonB C-terminal domain-containing protein [Gemmatimonadaceae bacterium]